MAAGEWIALAGVLVAAAALAVTVMGGLVWIVWPLAQLTADVASMRVELAKVMTFNDSRPCAKHTAEIKDIQSEVAILRGVET